MKCATGNGCIAEDATDCGNGRNCPPDALCTRAGGCITRAELAELARQAARQKEDERLRQIALLKERREAELRRLEEEKRAAARRAAETKRVEAQKWLEKNDLDRALRGFSDAIRLDPARPSLYTSRAIVYERKLDIARALDDYKFCLTLSAMSDDDVKAQSDAKRRVAVLTPAVSHSADQPTGSKSLSDALAECTKAPTFKPGPLMIPGPGGKDVALDRCYHGAADLDCRIKAITDEAQSINRDFSAIADAGYRRYNDIHSVCKIDIVLLKAQIQQSGTLTARFAPLNAEFNAEVECIDRVNRTIQDMEINVIDPSNLSKTAVDYLRQMIQRAGDKHKTISQLLDAINTSQNAMHAFAELHEAVCQ